MDTWEEVLMNGQRWRWVPPVRACGGPASVDVPGSGEPM